ncbi:peptidoglycan DD-metalloendopeptidase family protein [Planctobacterium marinum]|uniref:peptidoglycan DD-metalloendopeptidase family protein n=1 Tax=Planctobacterium marinum TaxID=1631968 RepID=UPI001E5CD50A|nr:peptidoglycan DD-metalloendopeptidase family protein [Planctobacterium marinum]MCC2605266.1 peptidoglycan DD-metalloendopeptidase family protein [Planctobacterium marinum]
MSRQYWILCLSFCLGWLSGCASNSNPAPVVKLNTHKDYSAINKGSLKAKNYTVKKGDTLYSIAFQAGKDFRELAHINNISAPYSIYPGQQLALVASKSRQAKKSSTTTGPTSKKQVNQPVDPPKKQAYGGQYVKEKLQTETFPQRVNKWVWPTNGRLVGKFSLSEVGNKGIDISDKRGAIIRAAADGKVVYTGKALRGYGNLIIIKHTDSYLSAYAHNDALLVREQQWVSAGEQIARMGSNDTGQVLLHFEIRYKGKSVDPLRYLPKR